MFSSTGGGGFGVPMSGGPAELAVMLVIVVGIIWLVTRLFSS